MSGFRSLERKDKDRTDGEEDTDPLESAEAFAEDEQRADEPVSIG